MMTQDGSNPAKGETETVGSVYRYRPIERLLGNNKELENGEIYFASPSELNDPMEGFQDVFWAGDHILWKNLIRHYILSLLLVVDIVHIMGSEFRPDLAMSVLHFSASTLPAPQLKDDHERICRSFFAEKGIIDCIKLLASVRPKVHRDELGFYLSSFHPIALRHVLNRLREKGYIKQPEDPVFPTSLVEETNRHINSILKTIATSGADERNVTAAIFDSGNRALHQISLLKAFEEGDRVDKGWRFFALEFTDFYCQHIATILYPSWYAACFVGNPTHAAMWAHYGNRHEGVCLRFRTEANAAGTPTLRLHGFVGRSHGSDGSTDIKGEQRLALHKVKYTKSFPQIDFFRSLGKLPIPVINKDWYSDNGELSKTAFSVFADETAWRENYWNNLSLVATTKFDDWQHEDEYRGFMHPSLDSETDKSLRIYKYNFDDLTGVIFGINTSVDNKLKIMKIIEQKCMTADRKEFEFLQAAYSHGTSKFDIFRLHHIKLA